VGFHSYLPKIQIISLTFGNESEHDRQMIAIVRMVQIATAALDHLNGLSQEMEASLERPYAEQREMRLPVPAVLQSTIA
jgi:hypothetical protein